MKAQLLQIVQGAVRKVLASDKVDAIMPERSKFGAAFAEEVHEQLKQSGVEPVSESGENTGYQQNLMTIEGIEGYVIVGGEQARALQAADVKIIANSGNAGEAMIGKDPKAEAGASDVTPPPVVVAGEPIASVAGTDVAGPAVEAPAQG